MCKQLKEKLLQALMDNMGSVIDTLDEHAKSIKELEQRISQLSAKGSGAERNKHIEFSMGSAALGDRDRYDAANGIYYKFLDSEHPGTYIIAILKSPCEKGKTVMCYAFLIHESNNIDTLSMWQTILCRYHIAIIRWVSVILSAGMRLCIYEGHTKWRPSRWRM